jgi:hypothetical protein
VYQFILWTFALATVRKRYALNLARLFVVVLYVHSGLSKLDSAFCHGLGWNFLTTAASFLGLKAEGFPRWLSTTLILAMPAWELAVGIGLCFRWTRTYALVGAVALHGALIGILGPWGLGHSTIVLIWNTAMIVEVVLLFRGAGGGVDTSADASVQHRNVLARWLSELRPSSWREVITGAVFAIVAIAPFGERWGLWDTWPSFALYAGHVERADVFLHESERDELPDSLTRHLSRSSSTGWSRLDVTGWSRAARGVPEYPQARTVNGLAEAIAGWGGRPRLVRVQHWGRANRFTGRRTFTEIFGLDAIRRWGDRYWLNAQPAGINRQGGARDS